MELVRARCADFGPTFAREAGRVAWVPAVGGDAAQVDGRGRRVAGEGASGGARAAEPAAAGVRGGSGADRRFAARLVRGSGASVHADRVHRRRDLAPAGAGVLRGGDDRGVHGDDAGASGGAGSAGGVLLGPVRRVPGQQKDREGASTQFPRALRTLDIAAVQAGSPQAKGRVERANLTLQDRLVKEMRLRGIDDMAAGNAYLPEFMADFNRRFAVAPRNPADAHRKVLHDAAELGLILCGQHVRKLTKNLTIGSPEPRVPGDGAPQGVPAARGAGDGVQGVRRLGDGSAGRPGAAGAAAGARRGAGPGGGREDGCGPGRASQGRTAGATVLQAVGGPSLAPPVPAGGGGNGGRMSLARSRGPGAPGTPRQPPRQAATRLLRFAAALRVTRRLPWRGRRRRPEGYFRSSLTGFRTRPAGDLPSRHGRRFRRRRSRQPRHPLIRPADCPMQHEHLRESPTGRLVPPQRPHRHPARNRAPCKGDISTLQKGDISTLR